jgi:hypothetical protein
MRTREKPSENPKWREKMMQRRKNVIRVFTYTRWCFIYKHVLLGPRATAQPINIFYSRSYILHTVDDSIKEEKTRKEDYDRTI